MFFTNKIFLLGLGLSLGFLGCTTSQPTTPIQQLTPKTLLSNLQPKNKTGKIETLTGLTGLGQRAFRFGLLSHGPSTLEYTLDGQCYGFQSFVSSNNNAARITLKSDNTVLWHNDNQLETTTGPLSLLGTQTLKIEIDAPATANVLLGNPTLNCDNATLQTTASLPAAPTVDSVFPWGNNIPTQTTISVAFSETIQPNSIGIQTQPPLEFASVFSNGEDNWYSWTPKNALQTGTAYQVTITGKDQDNNPVTAQWSFTTGGTNSQDTTPPSITSVYPWGENIGVGEPISVAFTEGMNPDSVNISTTPSIAIADTFSNGDDSWWRFTPSQALTPGTTYTITVSGKDNGGNSLAGSTTWSFKTKANQAPNVAITSPTNNATVALGDPITIVAPASDSDGNVSSVEFFAGTSSLGKDNSLPFEMPYTPTTPGPIALRAVATDNNGATGEASINVTAAVIEFSTAQVQPQSIGAVGDNNGTVHVFVRGKDNSIYHRVYNNQKAQSGWKKLGGTFADAPSATINGTRVDVFARNASNKILQRTWNGSAWSTWLEVGCCSANTPSAAWISGQLTVFVTGSDQKVWWAKYTNNAWSGFTARGNTLVRGAPSVVAWGASDYRLYARGNATNALLEWSSTGNENDLGGVLTTAPAAGATTNQLHVLARGTDNAVYWKRWNGSAWEAWVNVGGIGNGDLAATPLQNGALTGFATGNDTVTFNNYSNRNDWSGWNGLLEGGYSLSHKQGLWSNPIDWPTVAIHAALLPSGKIISWASSDNGVSGGARPDGTNGLIDSAPTDPSHKKTTVFVTDPSTLQSVGVNNTTTELFCSGHAQQKDGKLMVAGGNLGLYNGSYTGPKDVNLFDPFAQTWSRIADMTQGRWYPTVTALGNGEMLIHGGTNTAYTGGVDQNPIVWTGSTYRRLSGVTALAGVSYPWNFLTPTGKIFIPGAMGGSSSMYVLNTTGTGSLSTYARGDGLTRGSGSAVLYDIGKVLIVGGGTNTTKIANINTDTPAISNTNSMAFSRTHLNTSILADGSVAVSGGNTSGALSGADGTAVYNIEIWNPNTGTWTTGPKQQYDRAYHSTSLLLPDGRLWSSGGGVCGSCGSKNYNAEFYSPAYLFKTDGSGDLVVRPSINSLPASFGYATTIPVTLVGSENITKVALIRLGSATHAIDMDQRYVPMAFTQNGSSLSVTTPSNGNIAPPGYYMLVVRNASGVPSVGKIVRLQ